MMMALGLRSQRYKLEVRKCSSTRNQEQKKPTTTEKQKFICRDMQEVESIVGK